MRDRIASLNDRLERRRREATLAEPVTYRDVARFFLWRGGYALVGPLVILAGQPLITGVEGTLLMGGGFLAMVLAGFAGCARTLGRSSHVPVFGAVGIVALVAPVFLIGTTDPDVSVTFAGGMAVLMGFVSVLVALVASDTVRRELASET